MRRSPHKGSLARAEAAYDGGRHMANPKNSQAKRFAKPVINPNNKSNKVEIYHPTKGWRYVSPKRARAQALMLKTPMRGHGLAMFIKEGY